MPLAYWWEAFHTAVYLINCMPITVLHGKVPFTTLCKKEPDYHALRTFGSTCYPCLRPYQSNKFDFHTQKCVFLGYSGNHKGYRCLSPSGRVYTSRHVCFNEQDFPFSTNFLHNPPIANKELVSILSWLPIPQFLSNTPHTNPASSTITYTDPSSTSPDLFHALSDPINPLSNNSAPSSPSTSLDSPLTPPNPPQPNTHSMITRGKIGISKPKRFF